MYSKNVADMISHLIRSYPVFVVSKSHCPICAMAKNTLKNYPIPTDKIKIMEIENHKNADEIQNYMLSLTGGRSLPRVFIGQRGIIGGPGESETNYNQLKKFHQSGELKKWIQKAIKK